MTIVRSIRLLQLKFFFLLYYIIHSHHRLASACNQLCSINVIVQTIKLFVKSRWIIFDCWQTFSRVQMPILYLSISISSSENIFCFEFIIFRSPENIREGSLTLLVLNSTSNLFSFHIVDLNCSIVPGSCNISILRVKLYRMNLDTWLPVSKLMRDFDGRIGNHLDPILFVNIYSCSLVIGAWSRTFSLISYNIQFFKYQNVLITEYISIFMIWVQTTLFCNF